MADPLDLTTRILREMQAEMRTTRAKNALLERAWKRASTKPKKFNRHEQDRDR